MKLVSILNKPMIIITKGIKINNLNLKAKRIRIIARVLLNFLINILKSNFKLKALLNLRIKQLIKLMEDVILILIVFIFFLRNIFIGLRCGLKFKRELIRY